MKNCRKNVSVGNWTSAFWIEAEYSELYRTAWRPDPVKVGYARVSTKDQTLDLQLDALKKVGCSKIYAETVSGAKADRPELTKLMDALRAGDVPCSPCADSPAVPAPKSCAARNPPALPPSPCRRLCPVGRTSLETSSDSAVAKRSRLLPRAIAQNPRHRQLGVVIENRPRPEPWPPCGRNCASGHGSGPVALPAMPLLSQTPKDLDEVRRRYAAMSVPDEHPYLEDERRISADVLRSARFAWRIRIDRYGAAVFPHVDALGELCGFERKNCNGFTGFSPGGTKGMWLSNTETETVCSCSRNQASTASARVAPFVVRPSSFPDWPRVYDKPGEGG